MLPSLRVILEPWRLSLEPRRLSLETWRLILSEALDVNSTPSALVARLMKKTGAENLKLGHYKRKRISYGG
jgi:hypothetical protein